MEDYGSRDRRAAARQRRLGGTALTRRGATVSGEIDLKIDLSGVTGVTGVKTLHKHF